MAGTDPRRSSRARTAQPPSQISSTASSVSGRAERSTRSFNKSGSPQKSTPTASLSSEPLEDVITAEDTFGTRRRTRGQGEDRDKVDATAESVDMTNGSDDIQEEEDEAVRCICGFDDYPGPPPLDADLKHGSKDSTEIDPIFATDLTDEAAGFFVQCDICKVWQHGACVGIMNADTSPDEYFCEECRKDLHKIFTASNGQRYSHYLPLKRSSRATSRATSLNKDVARSPPKDKEKEKDKERDRDRETRNGRASSATQTKRRSTMNSREAAYDEAEALRRAIEASKEDARPDLGDSNTRRAKRGRSDSDEKPESFKRQRTSSRSVSPSIEKAAEDSEDEDLASLRNNSKSKSRSSAAARNHRAEKAAEKEERERQRAEAANKRKGRVERRRADGTASTSHGEIIVKVSETHHVDVDSDPSEEMPLARGAAVHRTTAAAAATATAGSITGTTGASTGPETSTSASTNGSASGSASGDAAAVVDRGASPKALVAGASSGSTPPAITATLITPTTETVPPVDLPEPAPPTPVVDAPPPSSQPLPDTPRLTPVPVKIDKKRSHKKKGRNQYTRDRDMNDEASPARSQSRDIAKEDHNGPANNHGNGNGHGNGIGNGNGHGHGHGNGHGRSSGDHSSKLSSKSRGGMSSKVTMSDMKRRAAALLDFISRTQLELAGEATPPEEAASGEEGRGDSSAKAVVAVVTNGDSVGPSASAEVSGGDAVAVSESKEFGDQNCMEMMDSLTRRLVKWQQEYTS